MRCPYSLLNGYDVVQSFDYEAKSDTYSNETSFCGISSIKNNNYLVWNLVSSYVDKVASY